MQVIEEIPTTLAVMSDTFTILPGALKSMAFIRDPGKLPPRGGCPRCPAGVHLAGATLDAAIELRDAFHNRIGFCREGAACAYLPSATVAAQLQLVGGDDAAAAPLPKLTGQLTDECSHGFLSFTVGGWVT